MLKIKLNILAAILYFMIALLISNINDVIAKNLDQNVHVLQMTALRFFFSTLMLGSIVCLYGKQLINTRKVKVHVFRAFLLVTATMLWFFGLNEVYISSATIISFSIPLFTLIFAFYLLREKLTYIRVTMTFIGFLGVFLVITPDKLSFHIHHYLMLLASAIYALLDTVNKKYANQESTFCMLFYSALFGSIMTFGFAIPVWKPLDSVQLILIALIGLGANSILFFIIQAYKRADVSFLTPLHYLELLPSTILGYVFFHEIPTIMSLTGAAIIAVSTLISSIEKRRDN